MFSSNLSFALKCIERDSCRQLSCLQNVFLSVSITLVLSSYAVSRARESHNYESHQFAMDHNLRSVMSFTHCTLVNTIYFLYSHQSAQVDWRAWTEPQKTCKICKVIPGPVQFSLQFSLWIAKDCKGSRPYHARTTIPLLGAWSPEEYDRHLGLSSRV